MSITLTVLGTTLLSIAAIIAVIYVVSMKRYEEQPVLITAMCENQKTHVAECKQSNFTDASDAKTQLREAKQTLKNISMKMNNAG